MAKCGFTQGVLVCVLDAHGPEVKHHADRSGHHCHARNCYVKTRPEMLMCRRHWFMVPKKLRDAVWATYSPGQCDGTAEITREWHDAADAAIEWVARREEAPPADETKAGDR